MLAAIFLGAILLTISPTALAQNASTANIVAVYKDAQAIVYDKVRGVYGRDYAYDWQNNKYSFFRNFTSTPAPLPSDVDPRNILILDGKLDENIWKDTKSIVVDLEPHTAWGGAIKRVSVKAANNGTWLFMAFEWEDSTESREESARVKRPEGGFFYNETHFYSDNLFTGWWLKDGRPIVKPWFNAHFAGTAMGKVPWRFVDTSAEANLWIFKAYWTDDDSHGWPVSYLPGLRTLRWGPHVGEPIYYPYPWMTQTLLNATTNYFLGTGIIHISGCAFPEKETFPFEVHGNGMWKDGVWTLEVARPFKTHPLNEPVKATMNFESDKTYWVFFGASDGQRGENEDVGSISGWLTLYIQPPPQPAFLIWVSIGVGVAAVAGIVGTLMVRRRTNARRRIETARTAA